SQPPPIPMLFPYTTLFRSVTSGHVDEALAPLRVAGIDVVRFHDFKANPDDRMIEAGRVFAAPLNVDSIIGLGGGSSLDCAKGIRSEEHTSELQSPCNLVCR